MLVTIWTMKPFKALFAPGGAFYSLVINFQIPHLHQQVLKAAPIVAQPTPMDAVFKFDPSLGWRHRYFYCGDYLIFILGVGIKKGIGVFAETLISLKWPILSIGMVLAFAFVTNYSGMSTTLALVLAGTGVMFPFFSPFLGWLGYSLPARTLLQTPCLVHCNRPRRSKSTSLTLCWWQQIPAAA